MAAREIASPSGEGKSTTPKLDLKDFRKLRSRSSGPETARRHCRGSASASKKNTDFLNLILANGYDPQRGLYLPLSDRPALPGYFTRDIENLPKVVCTVDGWNFTHLSNPLTLPGHACQRPQLRATNAGFLIVTHEFDCQTQVQFEETFAWSNNAGPFFQLDKELQRYRDYRGYCIVLSGGRSLHLHFLFSTRHLRNAPFDADFAQRVRDQSSFIRAIMRNVYNQYWDALNGLIKSILKPSVPPKLMVNSGLLSVEANAIWPSQTGRKPFRLSWPCRWGLRSPNRHQGRHQDQRLSRGAKHGIVPEEISVASPITHPTATSAARTSNASPRQPSNVSTTPMRCSLGNGVNFRSWPQSDRRDTNGYSQLL